MTGITVVGGAAECDRLTGRNHLGGRPQETICIWIACSSMALIPVSPRSAASGPTLFIGTRIGRSGFR